MMVLWGHVSPQLLRKVMELLHQDLQLHGEGHLDVDHIKKLAKLGHWGQYPNNVWTELKKILPTPKLPRLHFVWLPFKHLTLGKITRQVPLLLPHQVFGAIYQHYPAIWQQIVYGSQAKCKKSGLLLDPAPNSRATRSAKDLTTRPNVSLWRSMGMARQWLAWARAGQKWWTSFLCPLFWYVGQQFWGTSWCSWCGNIFFAEMRAIAQWMRPTRCSSGHFTGCGLARSQHMTGLARKWFMLVQGMPCVVATSLQFGRWFVIWSMPMRGMTCPTPLP